MRAGVLLRHAMVAVLLVAALPLAAIAGTAPDVDSDGVEDSLDNCLLVANPPPLDCDSDLDGYGNVCDADLNNDTLLGGFDFGLFLPCFTAGSDPTNKGCDLNCDTLVNGLDFQIILPLFIFGPLSGPSGLACAGTVPCP